MEDRKQRDQISDVSSETSATYNLKLHLVTMTII